MYEKVILITPGEAQEYYRLDGEEELLTEIPEEIGEGDERIVDGGKRPRTAMIPLYDFFSGLSSRVPFLRGRAHERVGVHWWMWVAIVLLFLLFIIALLWSRITVLGYPGVDVVGAQSVVGPGGSESISGTVVNTSGRTYREIAIEGVVFDTAGQQIDTFVVDLGTLDPKSESTFSATPMVNLGPAYRVQMQVTKSGADLGIPWWVWVLIATIFLLLLMLFIWATFAGYQFPGLEIVQGHLEPSPVGAMLVVGKVVNYSKHDYQAIQVNGRILDAFDRVIEKFKAPIGDVAGKDETSFEFQPRTDLGSMGKVSLHLSSID